MANADYILFAGPGRWRVARSDGGQTQWFDCDPDSAAAVLRESGYAGRPIVLAVASEDCLAVRVSTLGLPRGDRRALAYRLEERLPLAVEEIVADFAPASATGEVLAACVMLGHTGPLVTALEAAGIAIAAIVPATIAAAQTLTATAGNEDVVFLIDEPRSADKRLSAVTLRAGRPVDLALLPANVDDVATHLRFVTADLGSMPRVHATALADEFTDALGESLGCVIHNQTTSVDDAAVAFATGLLRGRGRAWFDFRRDELAARDRVGPYRRPLNFMLGTAAALLLAVTLTFLFRAAAYERMAANSRGSLTADFRTHFPDWVVPANVPAVVAAERRKALSAVSTPADAAAYGTAMLTLRTVLAGLPDGGRFALDGVSVQDASLSLTGRLTAFEQADAIAAAARRTGMDVPPPQTRRAAGGTWAFVIQGTRPTDKNAAVSTADRGGVTR